MREQFDPDGEYEEYDVDGTHEEFVREHPAPTDTESIDDLLEEDRPHPAQERDQDAPDYPSDMGGDESAAAEQGNRDGDEMVSEGDDPQEVAELDEDDQDVDAVGGKTRPSSDRTQVDIEGDHEGEDPLAGSY